MNHASLPHEGFNPHLNRRTVLLAAAALPMAACAPSRSDTYRYRMTIEVETPDGIRSGSSVRQVRTVEKDGILGGSVRNELKGEAVVIDLPGGKTLFGLLSSPDDVDYAKKIAYRLFLDDVVRAGGVLDDVTRNVDILAGLRSSRELPRSFPKPHASATEPSGYPLLVTFGDVNDPKTVESASPEGFATIFGPGISLRRIAVQITTDPATTGIEDRLKWLRTVGKSRSTLIPNPPTDESKATSRQLVTPSDFGTEIYK